MSIPTSTTAVSINTARQLLEVVLSAKLVPLLSGSPGMGKSELIHQVGNDFNLKVIDLRLAQCDPTDLLGFPSVDKEIGKATYLPMTTFPIEGDPLPEGKEGWLLFLDEFTSADRGVQKAAYKLVLDKMVGEHKLHDRVAIVCAGNLATDNAIVEEMSTALQSRLIHLELQINHKEWIEWAQKNNVDHRITSFINFKPDLLYSFSPDHQDKTYAAPRTWIFADRLLKHIDTDAPNVAALLAGTLSEGVAREFIVFTKIYKDLVSIQDILANPKGVRVPNEPSVLFALCGSIANNCTTANIGGLMPFLMRMPIEFQVVCLREIIRRNPAMLENEHVNKWAVNNASQMF